MALQQKISSFMLATVAALSLSACHSSLDIDVNPSGNVSSVIYINDDEGILATLGVGETCDDLLTTVRIQANQSNDDIQVEDTSTAGNVECRFSSASDGSFIKGKNLLETDDTYILKIDALEDIQPDQTQMLDSAGTFSLTITMPGDIIKAEGAEIHGNLATFTSFSSIAHGVFVEGLKEDPKASTSTGATTSKNSTPKDSAQKSSSSSFLSSVIIGGIVGGLIGLIQMFFVRRRNATPAPIPQPNPQSPTNPEKQDNNQDEEPYLQ